MPRLGFVQTVSRPTRLTQHSATLIDHVYTNSIDHTLSCNIVTVDISDHLGTLTKITLGNSLINVTSRAKSQHNSRKSEQRMFTESNDIKFKDLIDQESWGDVLDISDAQPQFEKFSEVYTSHYNTAYPPKKKHVRRENERKNSKPWILPWL